MTSHLKRIDGEITPLFPTQTRQEITLGRHDMHALQKHSQRLHMLAGQAWVTLNGRDYIVKSGESLRLESCDDRALISPLGESPVRYAVD